MAEIDNTKQTENLDLLFLQADTQSLKAAIFGTINQLATGVNAQVGEVDIRLSNEINNAISRLTSAENRLSAAEAAAETLGAQERGELEQIMRQIFNDPSLSSLLGGGLTIDGVAYSANSVINLLFGAPKIEKINLSYDGQYAIIGANIDFVGGLQSAMTLTETTNAETGLITRVFSGSLDGVSIAVSAVYQPQAMTGALYGLTLSHPVMLSVGRLTVDLAGKLTSFVQGTLNIADLNSDGIQA